MVIITDNICMQCYPLISLTGPYICLFSVTTLVQDSGMFNFALWVCTIVFASLSIVWGLIAMAFAAVNAGTRPIETMTGPMGLYLWNGLACKY